MTWNLTEFFENESQASEFCVNLLAEAEGFEKEYKNINEVSEEIIKETLEDIGYEVVRED